MRPVAFLQSIVVFGLAILLVTTGSLRAQPTLGSDFEIAFTERSPLSTKDDLLQRLNETAAADYDLSKERFIVYVPKAYDPKTPHGIVYYIGYKATLSSPPKWHPMLETSHLIFIAARDFEQPDWQRAGIALDSIHNLSKQYTIDKSRVYLIGYPGGGATVAQKLSLGAGDVFTEPAALVEGFNLFRPVRDPGGRGTYAAQVKPPPSAILAKARSQRVVLIVHPQSRQQNRPQLTMRAYQEEGFKDVMRLDIDDWEDMHYPNMAEAWFNKAMAFLDQPRTATAGLPTSATAAPSPAATPAATPATRPAVSEPQRLLGLARSYITARTYPAARTRLQEIITKYPNDPAAKEAKALLDQIKDR